MYAGKSMLLYLSVLLRADRKKKVCKSEAVTSMRLSTTALSYFLQPLHFLCVGMYVSIALNLCLSLSLSCKSFQKGPFYTGSGPCHMIADPRTWWRTPVHPTLTLTLGRTNIPLHAYISASAADLLPNDYTLTPSVLCLELCAHLG